jgi:hypothetical protein
MAMAVYGLLGGSEYRRLRRCCNERLVLAWASLGAIGIGLAGAGSWRRSRIARFACRRGSTRSSRSVYTAH